MQGVPVVDRKKQRLPACVGVDQPEVPATGHGDRVGGDRDQLDERRWCPEQPLVAGGVRQDAPVSRRGDDVTAPGDRIAASEAPHSSHSTPRRSRSRPMPAGGHSGPPSVNSRPVCPTRSPRAHRAGSRRPWPDLRDRGGGDRSPRGDVRWLGIDVAACLGFLPRAGALAAGLGPTSADRPLTRSPRCPGQGNRPCRCLSPGHQDVLPAGILE